MKMRIEFAMDTAAFEESVSFELNSIFSEIQEKCAIGESGSKIMDSNGNTIGQWEIKE